jgi:hypothetical protein
VAPDVVGALLPELSFVEEGVDGFDDDDESDDESDVDEEPFEPLPARLSVR